MNLLPRDLRVKLLSPTAQLPRYMSAGAAGADVFVDYGEDPNPEGIFGRLYGGSYWNGDQLLDVQVQPGTVLVPLGFSIEIPEGWVGILKGRSGLALRGHEGHVAYIDSDYRGMVHMMLHVVEPLHIKQGERIGQIAFMPSPQFNLVASDELSDTKRGIGGFGSTGVR